MKTYQRMNEDQEMKHTNITTFCQVLNLGMVLYQKLLPLLSFDEYLGIRTASLPYQQQFTHIYFAHWTRQQRVKQDVGSLSQTHSHKQSWNCKGTCSCDAKVLTVAVKREDLTIYC